MVRDTSLAVYRDLEQSGALSRLRLLVAKDVAEHGPTTQAETNRRFTAGSKHAFSFPQRFSELEEMGVIRAVGTRKCTVTGRDCLTWDLTGRMPTKFQPRESMRQLLRELLAAYLADAGEPDDRATAELLERVEAVLRPGRMRKSGAV